MNLERARRQLPLRATAVLALAVAAGFVVWLIVRGDGDETAGAPTATETETAAARAPALGPLIVSVSRLRAFADDVDHPVYWAGVPGGTRLELRRTRNAHVFVRYLPRHAPAGVRGRYLTVATYPVKNAFERTRAAGARPNVTRVRVGNGIAIFTGQRPTSVYFAMRGSPVQVEVFDPTGERARRLVLSGRIRPIR